jgi:hypothetical protein
MGELEPLLRGFDGFRPSGAYLCMRLVFHIGLVRKPHSQTGQLLASSEPEALGRWLTGSFGIKDLLAVAAVALTLAGMHASTASRLAAGEARQDALQVKVEDNATGMRALQHDSVQRSEYENDRAAEAGEVRILESNQTQILTAMMAQRPQAVPR